MVKNNADIGLDREYDGIWNVRIEIKELFLQLFLCCCRSFLTEDFHRHGRYVPCWFQTSKPLSEAFCHLSFILWDNTNSISFWVKYCFLQCRNDSTQFLLKCFCAGRSNDWLDNFLVLTMYTNFWLLVQRRNSLTHQHSLRRATTSLTGTL